MKITLLTIGKRKQDFAAQAEKLFIQRLKKFCSFEIKSLKDLPSGKRSPEEQKKKESVLLQKEIPKNALLICLDEYGKEHTAEEFSHKMEKWEQRSPEIIFLIGGHCGIDEKVLKKSQEKIALGKMTLTQDLALIVLLESLFRAFCIQKNIPFHRA